jgi:hypothetical protein
VSRPTGPRPIEFLGAIATAPRLVRDQPLAQGQVLALSDQAFVVLDFPGDTRVRVTGPALLAVMPGGQRALLLQDGVVSIDVPPAPREAAEGLWLATPGLRVDLGASAHCVVRAEADGTTEIAMAGGTAQLLAAEGGALLEPRRLDAGQTLGIDAQARVSTGTSGSRMRELNEALVAEHRAQRARAPASPTQVRARMLSRLFSALDELDQALARQRTLDTQHRAAVSEKGDEASRLQREIAAHGARLFRAKRSARATLAFFEAAWLADPAAAAESVDARVPSLRARAARLLP